MSTLDAYCVGSSVSLVLLTSLLRNQLCPNYRLRAASEQCDLFYLFMLSSHRPGVTAHPFHNNSHLFSGCLIFGEIGSLGIVILDKESHIGMEGVLGSGLFNDEEL